MSETLQLRAPADGLAIARYIKALAAAKNDAYGATAYGEGQRSAWSDTPSVHRLLKTAVGAIGANDLTGATLATAIFAEFIGLLRPRTLLDRIQGWRRVPSNVSVLRFTADATGAVVPEGAAIPVSKFSLERVTLAVKKIAALTVTTTDVMRFSSAVAEMSLAAELAKAVGTATDRAMFDVDIAGSIANGGTVLVSAGSSLANIDSDLKLMLATFAANDAALDSAVFVMSPTTAAYLASLRGSGGANAYPNVGARGGSLLGVPVFVSSVLTYNGSPSNSQITLFDPSLVLLADPGAAEITTSNDATIQMDSAPTENSLTPTGTTAVSMLETNCVAIAALRWVNWQLASSTAAVTLDNVAY